ncbi:hypothetical protein BV25DRAFT_1921455 [Artomyces pyxidatus]|uniref:Uncharacterized protein n=1 Tax=Artomyces pyxidatus TaxID=48021 RepID=A0ACB8SIR8_9AGAM|nr:hypothetical protein BV25DRAFT_1921455 [Artomyces pyxidatus]
MTTSDLDYVARWRHSVLTGSGRIVDALTTPGARESVDPPEQEIYRDLSPSLSDHPSESPASPSKSAISVGTEPRGDGCDPFTVAQQHQILSWINVQMVKYTDTERGWIRQQLVEQQSRLDNRLVEDRSRINRLQDTCQEAAKDNRANEAHLKSLRERVNEATELWDIVHAHILRANNLQTALKNHTNETAQRFAVLERRSPDEDRRNKMRVASLERAVRALHRRVSDAQVRNEESVEGKTRRAGHLEKVELRSLRPVLYTAVFVLSLVFHLLKVDVLSYVLSFFPTFNSLA